MKTRNSTLSLAGGNDRMLRLFGQLQRLNEQRHLYSVRTAFIATMPLMIVGAFAVVVNELPIPAYQQAMATLFGEEWTMLGSLVYNATMQIVTLMVVFSIGRNLTAWYNGSRHTRLNETVSGMLALACYAIVSIPVQSPTALPFAMTGVTGLFVAMVTALISTELFVQISALRKGSRLMTDDPNPAVPRSFAAVLPTALVIVAFALLRVSLVYYGVSESFGEIMYTVLSRPYLNRPDSPATAQLFNLSTHLMWLFGIHGNNVLEEVARNIFVPAMEQNIAAAAQGLAAPNLVTKTLFDVFVYMGGSGSTLALLVALLVFGKRRNYKLLFRYALPTSVFNINEPLIFGLPIVLNPIYAIPFVLTPVVMLSTTMGAMALGWVPYTAAEVSWATPIFVSGYVATGSVAGALLQLFNLAVGVCIYTPFVKLSERMMQFRFEKAYQNLCHIVTSDYSPSRGMLVARTDEVGTVARSLANQIDAALDAGDMYLHYQPIVDSRTNTLHSVEALLRWKHPQYGMINPMVTVALAEETGSINRLGLWVMEQAVRQRAAWNREELPKFHISVNASTPQLNDPLFSDSVQEIMRRHRLDARQIQLEITETAALVDNMNTGHNLARIHEMGISIAMDDFGVGHSSLLYLRTQPISTLKIDGSLSREVVRQPANLEIIATIHDLCNLLGVETVIEYVDNEQQLNLLKNIGTFLIQGYYYSPALPAGEIGPFIQILKTRPAIASR